MESSLFDQHLDADLRKALKACREAAALSQRALGKSLGQSHSYVNKVEGGSQRVDVIQFVRWCHACDVSPSKTIASILS
ncbi:MAG: helix-turn-helix domain-containing protein [Phycisphaeraceae bacterium]